MENKIETEELNKLKSKINSAKNDVQRIDSMMNVAKYLQEKQDALSAIPIAENALQIAESMAAYSSDKTNLNKGELKKVNGDILMFLSNCFFDIGESGSTFEYAIRAKDIYSEIGYVEGIASSLRKMAIHYTAIGKHDESIKALTQSISIAKDIGNYTLYANGLSGLGLEYASVGETSKAIDYFKEAIEIFTRTGDSENIGGNNINLGNQYHTLGDWKNAQEHLLSGIQICKAAHSQRFSANGLNNLGYLYLDMGMYEKAYSCFHECLSIAEEIHNMIIMSACYLNMGNLLDNLDQCEQGNEFIKKSLDISKQVNDDEGVAIALVNLAIRLLEQKNLENALAYIDEALEVGKKLDFEAIISACYNIRGNILVEQGKYEQATTDLELAMSGALKSRDTDRLAKIYHTLGILNFRNNLFDNAIEYFNLSLSEAIKLDSKPGQVQSHEKLVRVFEQIGDLAKALHHHKEYHRIEKEVFNEESDKRLKNLQIIHDVEKTKKESEILKLENDKMKTEYELQNKHLTTLTMALVQQNEFLQSLRNELLRLAGNVDSHIQSPLKDIARRLKKQSQAQEEWSAFEEQFQLIHADFIHRLSDKFPTLSPTELKVCALLRIGLSSKEISSLLCVTLRCVETHRYRIRKKMGLSASANMVLFLTNL